MKPVDFQDVEDYFLRSAYFTWVASKVHDMIPGDIITKARIAPYGTVRVLYPHSDNRLAFVNRGERRDGEYDVWEQCDGCYAVEEQCPLHGTARLYRGGRVLGF